MSIENPTDVDEYLEEILNDSGMELDKDLREEMVKELSDRRCSRGRQRRRGNARRGRY